MPTFEHDASFALLTNLRSGPTVVYSAIRQDGRKNKAGINISPKCDSISNAFFCIPQYGHSTNLMEHSYSR